MTYHRTGSDMKFIHKAIFIFLSAVMSTALMVAANAQAMAEPVVNQAFGSQAETLQGAPSSVRGYTPHARQRMRERGVTAQEVEFTVFLYNQEARRNSQGNWRYENSGTNLVVIMNDNAYVITVF